MNFYCSRVNYNNAISAANARIQLHQYRFDKLVINCYFAQPVTPIRKNLQPPAPFKQFLISPPASPPAGKYRITWYAATKIFMKLNSRLGAAWGKRTIGEPWLVGRARNIDTGWESWAFGTDWQQAWNLYSCGTTSTFRRARFECNHCTHSASRASLNLNLRLEQQMFTSAL